jgi:pyridoxal phosphate enzyme (YggS family)
VKTPEHFCVVTGNGGTTWHSPACGIVWADGRGWVLSCYAMPPEADDVRHRLAAVQARITAAAERAGRAAGAVTLVAVSKRKPASAIEAVAAAGCLDFGENYVQELADKATSPGSTLPPLRWHFIGHLQRNKVKQLLAVPGLVLLHGVHDGKLLRALNQRGDTSIDVLVQVNVSGEPSKSGCAPSELPALLETAANLERVQVIGLMTMPPADADPRPHFAALRELRDQQTLPLPQLSMGMSSDYEIAIEEGATIVRVGSAIFGRR